MADEIGTDALIVDWCARAGRLREVEMAILVGEMVTEARFGEDMAKYANANLADVKAALDHAIEQCQISRGMRPKRTRYAMRGMMRPY